MQGAAGGLARPFGAAVALVMALVLLAGPAAAHPFGPPPTARVSARGAQITIDWSATPDDAVAIGERLGIMPAGSVAAYRQESAAQVAPSGRDEARLSASAELATYLREHITATQGGRPCTPAVPPIPDFVHAGARIVLRCPQPVEQATLRITMLHDINDAYRTVAIGTATDPAQSVFTVTTPEFTWRFGVAASDRRPVGLYAAAAALAALVLVAGLLLRRRRRS